MSPEEFLFNNATDVSITSQNSTSMTRSRSGRVKSSINLTNPYVITFNVHGGFDYTSMNANLGIMAVTQLGYSTNFRIGNTSGSAYLTSYHGDLSSAEIANITINSQLGNKIWIDTTSTTGSGNIFKKGDYIQPKGNANTYQYPYTVTSDVAWTSGNVEVPLHRGVIESHTDIIEGNGIVVGNDVFFTVLHKDLLSFTITPGPNLQFDKGFTFVEHILL